jgi:DNA-binding MarR family transcriptional regulator
MSTKPTKAAAAVAWQTFLDVLHTCKPHIHKSTAPFGLTPQLAYALEIIARHESVTMRVLAEDLSCDASNATGVVDRLERRGLIERVADSGDRRVRRVKMTPAGSALYAELNVALRVPPPLLASLSTEDQRALTAILRRALEAHEKD